MDVWVGSRLNTPAHLFITLLKFVQIESFNHLEEVVLEKGMAKDGVFFKRSKPDHGQHHTVNLLLVDVINGCLN